MPRMTLQDVFDTEHPVALVTGSGAPRVGRAVAEELARFGCHVAFHANRSRTEAGEAADRLSERYSVRTIVTLGGLDQEGTPRRIVHETLEAFGRIDILVNSAAIWEPLALGQVTGDSLRRYFEINAVAPFLCAQAAGLRMVDQPRGGSIVNLGDWATVRPYLDHAAYFPSKGSIEVMTRSLAVELASRNPRIRVNCVCPGPVLLGDGVSPQEREQLAASTLVRRVGSPQAVAHAVRFLCENDFVTGVCLPVDGGRSIFAADGLQVGRNTG